MQLLGGVSQWPHEDAIMDGQNLPEAHVLDGADILDAARTVLQRVQRLSASTQSKSSLSVDIETLRNLTNILTEASSTVRVLLNSTASINSLPPELLARIFSSYATDEIRHGPCTFRAFKMPSARAAVRLTEVCKHWRNVALSTATLWSGIICGGRDETPYDRYLHLSRSSELHLIVNGNVETVGELFRDQPSRVRYLLLLDISEKWTRRRDPRDLLALVASDLLTCTLDLHFWPRGGLPEHAYSLFSNNASDLQELVIHNTKIIPTDDFPNLRRLMVDHIHGTPSLLGILALLDRCPRLEEACIHSSRQVAQLPVDPPVTETIQLPHLRRITLLMQRSMWLMSYIAVPSKCLVRLDEISLEEISILSHLPVCHQLDPARLTRLSIYPKTASPLIQAWMNEFCIELADASSESGLFLSIATPTSTLREHLALSLSQAFSANPLFSHVNVLWAVRQPTSFVLTPAVLRTLPTLTMLGIVFDDRFQVPNLGAVLSASGDPMLCPILAALCVQNCGTPEGSLGHVRRIVETRAHVKHRIRRLAIECPDQLLHPQALSLKQFVDDLIVRTRMDEEAHPPKEWKGVLECADDGTWPDWTYFVNPGHGRL